MAPKKKRGRPTLALSKLDLAQARDRLNGKTPSEVVWSDEEVEMVAFLVAAERRVLNHYRTDVVPEFVRGLVRALHFDGPWVQVYAPYAKS